MSATRSRKRSVPDSIADESDDDIHIIHVKKPCISTQQVNERKSYGVFNFWERTPRIKKFFVGILSKFGFNSSTPMEEESEAESECDIIEVNNNPSASFPVESTSGKLNYLPEYTLRTQNSKIFEKSRSIQDTFVTLPTVTKTDNKQNNIPSFVPSRTNSIHLRPKHCDMDILKAGSSSQISGNSCSHGLLKSARNTHSKSLKETRKVRSSPVLNHNGLINQNKNKSCSQFSKQQDGLEQNGDYIIENGYSQRHSDLPVQGNHCITSSQNVTLFNEHSLHNTKLPKPFSLNNIKSIHSTKNFTTDTVIRIQEREQYRELVHRFCDDPWNSQRPVLSKRSIAIQTNLDEKSTFDKNDTHSTYIKSTPMHHNKLPFAEKSRVASDLPETILEDETFKNPSVSAKAKDKVKSLPIHSLFARDSSALNKITIRRANSESSKPDSMGRRHLNSKSCDKTKLPDIIYDGVKLSNSSNDLISKFDRSSWGYNKNGLIANNSSIELPDVICDDDEDSHILELIESKAKSGKVNDIKFDIESTDDACNKPSQNSLFLNQAKNTNQNITSSLSMLRTNSGLFCDNWIQDLKRTVEIEAEERQRAVADQERQLQAFKMAQAHKYAKFKGLLQLSDSGPSDIVYLEDQSFLVPLTPEMNTIIDEALLPHSPNEVMSVIANFTVLWKDIDTLNNSNWLNDEIINVYMFLIQERSKLPDYPSVYAFTSFFYPKLKFYGYSSVHRWTRKVDIFQYDLLLVPLHLGVHWCLAVIDNRYKKIRYYDSMDTNENCLGILRDYMMDEHNQRKKRSFDPNGWEFINMKDIPPQYNGSDCGMFTLMYAEYVARNAKINFTQQDMLYFRRKVVYEIITAQLM